MNRRRLFVTAVFAAVAATLLPGRSAAAPPPLADPARLRRLPSGHYVLDNWVLTARDLEAMGIHVR